MGNAFHNDQRPYQLLAAPTFVRIVDRQINLPSNRFTFEHAGPQTKQVLLAGQDAALVAAAALGWTTFAGVGSQTLVAWPAMSGSERDHAWRLYELDQVARWVEVHQVSPFHHNRGPDLSALEDQLLMSSAKQGRPQFDVAVAQVLGGWWLSLALADQDAFFFNYEET